MDRFAIVLLASAIGAAAGVFVMKALDDRPAEHKDGDAIAPTDALLQRLERIEARLDERPEPLTLRGNAPAPTAFSLDSPEGKRLLEAIGKQVKASAKEAIDENAPNLAQGRVGATAPGAARWNRSRRKRVSLDDLAKELELSGNEQQALADVYDESKEKLFKMLAGENGDVEAVRQDYERSQENPQTALTLMSKYIPNITKNLGGFIALRTEQQQGIEEAIGKEKAGRLQREYTVEGVDVLNPGAMMGLGRSRRR